jgi:hypothetical protein
MQPSVDPLANIISRANALFDAIENAEHRAQYLASDTPDITEKKKRFFCKLEDLLNEITTHLATVKSEVPICIRKDGGKKTRKQK